MTALATIAVCASSGAATATLAIARSMGAPSCCPKCSSPRFWQKTTKRGRPYVVAKCRKCHRESLAKDRAKHGGAAARNKVWESQNREKALAHRRVEKAILTGRLEKQLCERCGADRVEAHHDDYSRPLDVMWLCSMHHKERHRELEGRR